MPLPLKGRKLQFFRYRFMVNERFLGNEQVHLAAKSDALIPLITDDTMGAGRR